MVSRTTNLQQRGNDHNHYLHDNATAAITAENVKHFGNCRRHDYERNNSTVDYTPRMGGVRKIFR